MRGQSEQALELLNAANQLQPNNPVTLYNRGITYAIMNRSREAIVDFTSVLASSPDASIKETLLVGLMQEHMALGENQQSLQYGDQLLQEYPANLRVRFLKGTLLLRMGQPTQAVDLLRAAVEQDASYAQAWYNLAVAQMNTGDKASARSSLQKARSLGLTTNPNLELQLQ
jgi:Flp pilus assembly protein TadD